MILLDTRRPVTATIPTHDRDALSVRLTGHTVPCVERAHAVMDATGAFGGRALSDGQRHAETVDALTDHDIECVCPGTPAWDRVTGAFAQ